MKNNSSLVVMILLLIYASGCNTTQPAALLSPPTETAARSTNTILAPTATPSVIQPSATSMLFPTATPIPPTMMAAATPTAMAAATALPTPWMVMEKSPQLFGYTETFQVALGDLDSDGDLDAVFANMADNHSAVWLNDGAGQFEVTDQQLTQQGHGLDIGDLDGDGDLDIFITCAHYNGAGKPSVVYLNNGLGVFQGSGQDLGDAGLSGNGVNLLDVDNDGDLDAHVVYYEMGPGEPDKIYLNDGQGRFTDSELALQEQVIAWGDVDSDGDVDIFAKTFGQDYKTLINDGSGGFASGSSMPAEQAMDGDIVLADFDADGDLDALIANGFRSQGSIPSLLLINDGVGGFSDSGQQLNPTRGADFAIGDMDGDGTPDVFVANMDQPDEVWLNNGTGRLSDSGLRLEGSTSRSLSTVPSLGDLDGDGDLDVFQGSFRDRPSIWFNEGLVDLKTDSSSIEPGSDKVVLIFGNRFINELYTTVRQTLEGAGYQVQVASTTLDPLQPKESGGKPVQPDLLLKNVQVDGYEAVVFTCDNDLALGGGRPETDRIAQQALEQEIVLAAICNAPLELGFAGVLQGRTVTGEPSQTCRRLESEFGADCTGVPVERDGLIITARDRFSSQEFAKTIIEVLDKMFAEEIGNEGGLIAFVSTRDGDGEIYRMNTDGSDLRQLTDNTKWDGFPTWSPDGSQIAYYQYVDKKNWVIMVMEADGSNPRKLTDNGTCDGAPYWSPDGKRIAYSSDADCTGEHREIYVMGADGGSPHNLTRNDADDMSSSWSPDSQQIVFSSNRDGDYEIYIMSDDGSVVNQLTDNEAEDLMPGWSPDGACIAFVSDRDGNDEIYVMGIDGENLKRLTYDSPNDWFPFWSSDGRQLLFNSWRDGNLEIYVMDAEGGNVRRLTNDPQEDFNAVWQP
jgi:Tol biopolymer transport system component/putative intracellular protease/amidase